MPDLPPGDVRVLAEVVGTPRLNVLPKPILDRVLTVARQRRDAALTRGRRFPVVDHMLVELAIATGLRLKEIHQLRVGDVLLDHRRVYVLEGKRKPRRSAEYEELEPNPRLVTLHAKQVVRDLRDFLAWKAARGESVESHQPLFASPRRPPDPLGRTAIQRALKRCLRAAGLPSDYVSFHATRHTYAVLLYQASGKDVVYVMGQLGHARLSTTQIYLQGLAVPVAEIDRAFERLLFSKQSMRGGVP